MSSEIIYYLFPFSVDLFLDELHVEVSQCQKTKNKNKVKNRKWFALAELYVLLW